MKCYKCFKNIHGVSSEPKIKDYIRSDLDSSYLTKIVFVLYTGNYFYNNFISACNFLPLAFRTSKILLLY